MAPRCSVLHPEGGGVEWTPLEDFVSQQVAGLPVLVTQQRVDKWVAGCLAVGQTFGQHAPVRTYRPRGEELYNSTSNKDKKRKIKSNTIHASLFSDKCKWCGRLLKQMTVTLPSSVILCKSNFTSMKCQNFCGKSELSGVRFWTSSLLKSLHTNFSA